MKRALAACAVGIALAGISVAPFALAFFAAMSRPGVVAQALETEIERSADGN